MPSTIGNGHRGGSTGRGASPGSELEQLIEQGQQQLKQIMPGGGLAHSHPIRSSRGASYRSVDRLLHGSEVILSRSCNDSAST